MKAVAEVRTKVEALDASYKSNSQVKLTYKNNFYKVQK